MKTFFNDNTWFDLYELKVRYSSESYPAQNNELVATEDVNPFKIGLEEQPTYFDSEIEDISSGREIF